MKYVFFIFIVFGFASCDPGVTYFSRIENNSDYRIKLSWALSATETDSIILSPKEVGTVFELSKRGHANEFFDCPILIDSLNVQTLDTNLFFIGELNYASTLLKEKPMNSEIECRTIINNSMFQ